MSTSLIPSPRNRNARRPIVIAHRGASGYLPEHTLAAYALAIEQGADFVEPDLVMTGDGVLIARHENEIGATTDVARHPAFATRFTRKEIDGVPLEGWFAEDFTLAEIKTLRARERIPAIRPANTRFDGMFAVPTLDEVIHLVRGTNERFRLEAEASGHPEPRIVGLYPETKHPSYHDRLGLPMTEPLLRALHGNGFTDPDDPVFIQSFEVSNLQDLRGKTRLRLIQLMQSSGQPYDLTILGDDRSYADLRTSEGLAAVAAYSDGIGAEKDLLIPRHPDGRLARPTRLIEDAHARGLVVHGWTFRAENRFLPLDHRRSAEPDAVGDLSGEVVRFLDLGMDGVFTDHPNLGVQARDRGFRS
jgi:glycerophosphoryl diester phosphodiesterase